MKIHIPTSAADSTPMTVVVRDVCPICGAARFVWLKFDGCDLINTDCEHNTDTWYWLRQEAANTPAWREHIALLAAPVPTFTPADDGIPFGAPFEPQADPAPYRQPAIPTGKPQNYAAELDNERVNIVRLERQKAGTFHLAICETDDDEHKRVDVQVWTEHRNLLKKAGYVLDWQAKTTVLSKPIPVILVWKAEHSNLRIKEVYTP